MMLPESKLIIDPRTAILLLITANIVSFVQDALIVEISFFLGICLVLIICNLKEWALKWSIFMTIIILIEYLVFPMTLKMVVTGYSILFVYLRKIIPCLMVGTILVKKIKLRYITLSLEKWHFPQSIIIPLMITLRYIPSIKKERRQIRRAMIMRNIKGFRKFEYTIVPMIMSAINTSEELSAAAVTRGIENPCKKTSIIHIKMKTRDLLILAVCALFIVLAFISRGDSI